jgi:hypothetical protein
MLDISIHKYQSGEGTSAYNAPHKFRIAKKSGNDTDSILRLWNVGRKQVLDKFVASIKEKVKEDSIFAIALAPSNTQNFINDIKINFPNSIDISDCFTKINGFEAAIIKRVLDETELRSSITLSKNCFLQKINSDVKQILLVDDVYSLGNTINAMKLGINDISDSKEIVTAVILRTT